MTYVTAHGIWQPAWSIWLGGWVGVLWPAALGGWLALALSLRRGLSGEVREAALVAHTLTLILILLRGFVLGHGLLFTIIAAASCWWSLLLVTGLRAERLVDPGDASAVAAIRLACWLALSGGATVAGCLLVG